MELRHLRSFMAAADEGSVTRAAARLYIAQPALTRQLQELERHVGVRLFVRHARGIRLTEPGSRLLLEARSIVTQADRFVELAAAAADNDTDVLTIGLLDEGAGELTSPILAAVRAAHPRARVVARSVPWGPHSAQLRAGELDGVIGARFAVEDDEFDVMPLFSDSRVVALPAASELAAADRVDLDDLLQLAPLSPTGLPQAILDHFLLTELRGGEGPREDLTRPFFITEGLAAVAEGSAFLTVTAASQRFFRHPGVVFRPVPQAPLTETVLAMPRSAARPTLVDSLVALAPGIACSLIGLMPGATVHCQINGASDR